MRKQAFATSALRRVHGSLNKLDTARSMPYDEAEAARKKRTGEIASTGAGKHRQQLQRPQSAKPKGQVRPQSAKRRRTEENQPKMSLNELLRKEKVKVAGSPVKKNTEHRRKHKVVPVQEEEEEEEKIIVASLAMIDATATDNRSLAGGGLSGKGVL